MFVNQKYAVPRETVCWKRIEKSHVPQIERQITTCILYEYWTHVIVKTGYYHQDVT